MNKIISLILILVIVTITQHTLMPNIVSFQSLLLDQKITPGNGTLTTYQVSYLNNSILYLDPTIRQNIETAYTWYYRLIVLNRTSPPPFPYKVYYALSPNGTVRVYELNIGAGERLLLSPSEFYGLFNTSNFEGKANVSWSQESSPTTKIIIYPSQNGTYISIVSDTNTIHIVTIEFVNGNVKTFLFWGRLFVTKMESPSSITRAVEWLPGGGYVSVPVTIGSKISGLPVFSLAPGQTIKLKSKTLELDYYYNGNYKIGTVSNGEITNDVTVFGNIVYPTYVIVKSNGNLVGFLKMEPIITTYINGCRLELLSSIPVSEIVNINAQNYQNGTIYLNGDGQATLSLKVNPAISNTIYYHYPLYAKFRFYYNKSISAYQLIVSEGSVKVIILSSDLKIKKIETVSAVSKVKIEAPDNAYVIINGYVYRVSYPTLISPRLEALIVIIIAVAVAVTVLKRKGYELSDILPILNREEEIEEEREEPPLYYLHYNVLANDSTISEKLNDYEIEVLVFNPKRRVSYSVWVNRVYDTGVIVEVDNTKGTGRIVTIPGTTTKEIDIFDAHKIAVMLRSIPDISVLSRYLEKQELKLKKGKLTEGLHEGLGAGIGRHGTPIPSEGERGVLRKKLGRLGTSEVKRNVPTSSIEITFDETGRPRIIVSNPEGMGPVQKPKPDIDRSIHRITSAEHIAGPKVPSEVEPDDREKIEPKDKEKDKDTL